MKGWFPLTDYDFYACVSAGILIVAAIDYSQFGGALTSRTEWSISQSIIWIGVSYLVGQIAAGPSSSILEHLIARKLFHTPTKILLGFEQPRWREKTMAALFAQFEYRALPSSVQERVKKAAAKRIGVPVDNLEPEAIFQAAFPVARGVPDTVIRLDRFISLYGFARNISFASFVSMILLSISQWREPQPLTSWLILGAGVFAAGMFGRFIKFYAAYGAEVLRTFSSVEYDGAVK